eukprot:m51a1_g10571 hypothetical protein (1663) ;mRNA; r:46287-52660
MAEDSEHAVTAEGAEHAADHPSDAAPAPEAHAAPASHGAAAAPAQQQQQQQQKDQQQKPPPEDPRKLPSDLASLHHSFGFESRRRFNIYYVGEGVLAYACGCIVHIVELKPGGAQRYLPARSGTGIGALSVHPQGQFLAVGEKGNQPSVFVYQLPGLEPYRQLSGGATRAYCDVCFSPSGSKMASVAGAPDFTLTVWDWEREAILLKTKAFSQDIYKVTFSPSQEGQLTTAGVGHIMFWRMARTFTGLKLQGEIGKFGRCEISDIAGYAELPDGKVISGTETGSLLLWDANMIKAEIKRTNGETCHVGMIEEVILRGDRLITAGHDGYIRLWDFATIDNAEISERGELQIDPLVEYLVGPGVQVKALIRGSDGHLLAQDACGGLYKVDIGARTSTLALSVPSGAIRDIAVNPQFHLALFTGEDGCVSLCDVHAKTMLAKHKFNAGGHCVTWAPASLDPDGLTAAVGFADGVIRVLTCTRNSLVPRFVSKPHTGALTCLRFSAAGGLLATGSADKTVWLFKAAPGFQYEPLGFVCTPSEVVGLSWVLDDVVIVCKDGSVVRVKPPRDRTPEEIDESFEIKLQAKPLPLSAALPGKISLCYPVPGDELKCLAICEGNAGLVHVLDFDEEATRVSSIEGVVSPPVDVTALSVDPLGAKLLVGGSDGRVLLWDEPAHDKFWQSQLHDSTTGSVSAVAISFDGAYVVSAAADGSFFVSKLAAKSPSDVALPASFDGEVAAAVEDIVDSAKLSLQEAKLKSVRDQIHAETEVKKSTLLKRVESIRESFFKLVRENEKQPPEERLTADEWRIDQDLEQRVEEETQQKLSEERRRSAYDSETKEVAKNKLLKRYVSGLEAEKVTVFAFASRHFVSTFGLAKLSSSLLAKIKLVHSIIDKEEENRRLDAQDQSNKPSVPSSGAPHPEAKVRADGKKIGTPSMANSVRIEERKKAHQDRQKDWEVYRATKPDDHSADPEDVEAVKNALRYMGDYPLKMARDYKVPENQRINADMKLRQRVLLEEAIYKMKKDFNDRVFGLRDRKRALIARVKEWNKQVVEINGQINVTEDVPDPALRPEENPEARLVVDREAVFAFERRRLEEHGSQTGIKAKRSSLDLGFKQAMMAAEVAEEGPKPIVKTASMLKGLLLTVNAGPQQPKPPTRSGFRIKMPVPSNQQSELEAAEADAQRIRLQYEKEQIALQMNESLRAFDKDLDELRVAKFQLEADLKMASMKMLILYQELSLLKEFEKQDTALTQKLAARRGEKTEITAKISELNDKLSPKLDEMGRAMQKVKDTEAEFRSIVGENNPYGEQLRRIFERQPPKKPKKAEEANAEDDLMQDKDEDGGDDYDESYDSDDDEDDSCPHGCEQALYERVLAARERRVTAEDAKVEIKRVVERHRQEMEALAKKEKGNAFPNSNSIDEIRQFQLLKQQRLNEIPVVIMLRMHQVSSLRGAEFPEDFSSCVVFSNGGLARLHTRIEELQQELGGLDTKLKGQKKELLALKKDKLAKEKDMKALETWSHDVQILRFGKTIENVEALDRLTVNKAADEMRDKLNVMNRQWARGIASREKSLKAASARYYDVLRRNTELLMQVEMLVQQKQQLEAELETSSKGMTADFSVLQQKDRLQEEKLARVAALQHEEILDLKAEIERLIHSPASVGNVAADSP